MNVVVKSEHPNDSPPSTTGILRTSASDGQQANDASSSATSMTSSAGQQGHAVGPTVSFSLPHIVQHIVHSPTSATTNGQEDVISDEEAKRRRELLARRPSYRKILNDLSCVELDLQQESDSGGESSEESSVSNSAMTGSQAGMPSSTLSAADNISYVASIPTGGLPLPTNINGDLNVGHLLPPMAGSTLLQYQMPNVGGADLLGLKPLAPTGPGTMVSQGLLGYSSAGPSSSKPPPRAHSAPDGPPVVEEASKKREIRLLKNREAAKECRRKKKEYVKCLENRVTVLEAQNKQLIEELRALKDLYCRKAD